MSDKEKLSYNLNTIPYAVFTRLMDLATRPEVAHLQKQAPEWQHKQLIKENIWVQEIEVFGDSKKIRYVLDGNSVEVEYDPTMLWSTSTLTLSKFTTMEKDIKILRTLGYFSYVDVTFSECLLDRNFLCQVGRIINPRLRNFYFIDCTILPEVTPGLVCKLIEWKNEMEMMLPPQKNWFIDMTDDYDTVLFRNCTADVFDVDKDKFWHFLQNHREIFLQWNFEEMSVDELEEHIRRLFKYDYEYILLYDNYPAQFDIINFKLNCNVLSNITREDTPVCIQLLADGLTWSYLIRPKPPNQHVRPWRNITSRNYFIFDEDIRYYPN